VASVSGLSFSFCSSGASSFVPLSRKATNNPRLASRQYFPQREQIQWSLLLDSSIVSDWHQWGQQPQYGDCIAPWWNQHMDYNFWSFDHSKWPNYTAWKILSSAPNLKNSTLLIGLVLLIATFLVIFFIVAFVVSSPHRCCA
jgi:hypothetical protein